MLGVVFDGIVLKIAYLDEHTDGHVYAEDIEAEVSAIEGHTV